MVSVGNSLTVPVVLWGNKCPTHCISSILVSANLESVITGSHDGQICHWNLRDGSFKADPSKFFVGHTKAVRCLTWMQSSTKVFISASDAGEMCVWDLEDASCIEAAVSPFIHSSIRSYTLNGRRAPHLFCSGSYPEILVYDAQTLSLQFHLISKLNPDWITSFILFKPQSSPDDVIIGLSLSGSMKVWTIAPDFKGLGREVIFENESKQIRVQGAWTLKSCPQSPRTMLIVTPFTWHIYDVKDFSVLCSCEPHTGVLWESGEFLNTSEVLVFGNDGCGYLYRLPANSVAGGQGFRVQSATGHNQAMLTSILRYPNENKLACQPKWTLFRSSAGADALPFRASNYIFRGDARGRISVWAVPEISPDTMPTALEDVSETAPIEHSSLEAEWDRLSRRLPGLIDRSEFEDGASLKITSSLYSPAHGRMFLGMDDGSIVMLPALKLASQVFVAKRPQSDLPVYRFLRGHEGRVTALLYPHQDDTRYDPGLLISGGVDFSVRVWDLYQCELQHTFVSQAGEILSLMTPPAGCNNRVLNSICSIASDHSVALLSLKERKAIMMASRHVFPIRAVKWRPMDDFLLVQCTDGTVYVWQIETGHLDRVVMGSAAEDVMQACEEEYGVESSANEEIGTNTTLQLFRAIKHRNMEAARQAAQRGLKNLSGAAGNNMGMNDMWSKTLVGSPLTIQPVRSNPTDQENHILLFDVEALILQIIADETRNETQDQGASPTPRRADWRNSTPVPGNTALVGSSNDTLRPQRQLPMSSEGMTMTMEIAQILLSFLYAWGLDKEMDHLVSEKLGICEPKQAINYGIISKTGYITLLLPTNLHRRKSIDLPQPEERRRDVSRTITKYHWSASSALTTMHLMTVVSLANTLMNIQNATFLPDHEKRRKMHRRLLRMDSKAIASAGLPETTQGLGGYSTSDAAQNFIELQAQVKHAWSQLTTFHCCLLAERLGLESYKPPNIEILIRRWQDRCLEIRAACQALILSELRRIGVPGRRALIEQWSPYLPEFPDNERQPVFEVKPVGASTPNPVPETPASEAGVSRDGESEFEELNQDLVASVDPSLPSVYSVEYRKKQSIAIILLGIIGAEFGPETQSSMERTPSQAALRNDQVTLSVTDPMVRSVAKALSYIVINPEEKLQPHSSLRRSAAELLGRGFAVWEPFVDVGQVLLALLRLTLEAQAFPQNYPYGVPLPPALDMARSARKALDQIASIRPPVFITVMNMEITKHNSLIQTAQTININLNNAVIVRAKEELLRILEMLINKHPQAVADLIVEVIDILVHALDGTRIKAQGLLESFPPISRFPAVSYCKQNRRIAAGSKKGGIFIYELRGMKMQSMGGHAGPVSACEFSPDGKYLATFSFREGKVMFWQIGTTFLGLGTTAPKCIKTSTAKVAVLKNWPDLGDQPDYKQARLRWIVNTKFVVALLANGKDEKFSV